MDLAGRVIAGYRLQQRLSATAAERAVYTASALDGGEPVVIKAAPLAASGPRRSLAEEFAILEQLQPAQVIRPLGQGIWLPDQVQYLILKQGGPSLAVLLAGLTNQRMAPGPALAVAHAAALALASLHQRGWVHGDVKPSNLLLNPDGSITLSDLEFACPVSATGQNAPAEDVLAGTPPFLAPELWREGRPAQSPAADVWALGVVLYVSVVAAYPFGQGDLAELARRVREGQPPSYPQSMPREVRQVCERFLAHDLAVRPAKGRAAAGILADALAAFPEAQAQLRNLLGPVERAAVPVEEISTGIVSAESYQLEVASVAMGPPPAAAAPAPAAVPAAQAAPGSEGLRRRSAARWFHRMNPQRSFALSVIFSGLPIQLVALRGMRVAVGEKEIVLDPSDPLVEVEPCFPGCLVTPPRGRADLTEQTVVVPFWITPLTEGDLPQACVRVYYRDRLVQTLATPCRVVQRTLARVFAWAGVGWPVLSSVLEAYDWTLTAQIKQKFPLLAPLVHFLGGLPGVILLTVVLFGLAGLFYWLSRPVEGGDNLPVVVTPTAGKTVS
jgi:hypothetical protein